MANHTIGTAMTHYVTLEYMLLQMPTVAVAGWTFAKSRCTNVFEMVTAGTCLLFMLIISFILISKTNTTDASLYFNLTIVSFFATITVALIQMITDTPQFVQLMPIYMLQFGICVVLYQSHFIIRQTNPSSVIVTKQDNEFIFVIIISILSMILVALTHGRCQKTPEPKPPSTHTSTL